MSCSFLKIGMPSLSHFCFTSQIQVDVLSAFLAGSFQPHLSHILFSGTGCQPLFPPSPVLIVPRVPMRAENAVTHRGRGLGQIPPGTAQHAKLQQPSGVTRAAGVRWC